MDTPTDACVTDIVNPPYMPVSAAAHHATVTS